MPFSGVEPVAVAVNQVTTAKVVAFFIAKFPIVLKVSTVGLFVFAAAAVAGLPIHDIWFDYVLFMVASAIVGGAPEPDTDLSLPRFFYTWFYRSGHLLVASATAYFLHQRKWESISDGEGKPSMPPFNPRK